MKHLTILTILWCASALPSLSCDVDFVPYIDGPEAVEVNGTATYVNVMDDSYRNSSGGYTDTEWSLTGRGIIGFGEQIVVDFAGLSPGSYILTAKNQFAGGCYGCLSNTTFTRNISICTKPPGTTATGATLIKATSFQANWLPVSGATKYLVTITPTSPSGPATTMSSTTTSYVYTLANPATSYSYYVRAVICVPSDPSNSIPVTTPQFGKPTVNPDGGGASTRRVKWTAVTGAYNYQVQVSDYSNFSQIWDGTVTTDLFFEFDAEWCWTYYTRVRALAQSGAAGPWSNVLTWGPGAGCSISGGKPIDSDIYPNPTIQYSSISLPKDMDLSRVTVGAQDMNGNAVNIAYSIVDGKLQLDAGNTRSGLYFITVSEGDRVVRLKMSKK